MTEPRSSAKDQSDDARHIFGLQLQLARFGEPPVPLGLDVAQPADVPAKGTSARCAPNVLR